MSTFFQDIRYGVRMMTRKPGFTVIAVIALALGIGANTAIFSVVNTVLLRPLPFDDPDRLMVFRETKLPQFPEFSVAPANFLSWQEQNTLFDRIEAHRGTTFNLIGKGEPERLRGAKFTSGMLSLLGVAPEKGRDFLPEEDQPGHDKVVLVSHGLWLRNFGGDPNFVGQTLNLGGEIYTVIGIMPETFRFPYREADLWTPMAFDARDRASHGGHYVGAVGRLKPGVSFEQAQTEMVAIASNLEQQFPDSNAGWSVKLIPMLEAEVGEVRPALLVLLGAVALVLLIACVNVANLLLARAASRQKEISIRTALGASRWRIARQLLTESVLLALAGGAVGLLLAIWGLDLLLTLAPENLPRVKDVAVDARALGFTFLITVFTGALFGLMPALQASRPDLNETLKEGGRGSTEGGRRQRIRNTLVVVEIALALILLVGAGLLIRSFITLQHVDPGYNAKNATAVFLALPQKKYAEDDQEVAFFRQLIQNVSTLPGVEDVGATNVLPLTGDYVLGFNIEGRPPDPPGQEPSTNYYAISPDYFKAMGIPLLRGRFFTENDTKDSPHVAIISESMAKRFFPGEDPIGKRINVTNGPETFREIVGIVGDVKQYGLDKETTLQTYEPYLQKPTTYMTLIVRSQGDVAGLGAAIRSQVQAIDKDQPVSRITPVTEILSASVAQQRFSMLLLGVFAGVAMLLAGVGLYGVMAYSVTQRTHEIGIRMALGAGRGDVLKMVVGQGMALTGLGLGIGLGGALALAKLMSSFMSDMLFKVSTTDPWTFAAIPVVLAVVAFLACYVPARRATKVDPMIALRHE